MSLLLWGSRIRLSMSHGRAGASRGNLDEPLLAQYRVILSAIQYGQVSLQHIYMQETQINPAAQWRCSKDIHSYTYKSSSYWVTNYRISIDSGLQALRPFSIISSVPKEIPFSTKMHVGSTRTSRCPDSAWNNRGLVANSSRICLRQTSPKHNDALTWFQVWIINDISRHDLL